jgi:hypothetical protein
LRAGRFVFDFISVAPVLSGPVLAMILAVASAAASVPPVA